MSFRIMMFNPYTGLPLAALRDHLGLGAVKLVPDGRLHF
jgi:hypothetical protein